MAGEHFVPGRGGIAPRWGCGPFGHGWAINMAARWASRMDCAVAWRRSCRLVTATVTPIFSLVLAQYLTPFQTSGHCGWITR